MVIPAADSLQVAENVKELLRSGLVNVPENYDSVPDTRKGYHYISGAARPKM